MTRRSLSNKRGYKSTNALFRTHSWSSARAGASHLDYPEKKRKMFFLPAQAGLLPALTFALLLSPKFASSLSIQQEHLALRSPLWDSASRNDSNPLINHS